MIKVFISSVQKEFAQERDLLCKYIREDALLGKFFQPFIFENLPAINLSAPQAYLAEAATSEIYLGLYGRDYGYEDAEGISPTEREYNIATDNSHHRIIFIKRCSERHPKEKAFIQKVEENVVRKSFENYEELRTSVYSALVRYLEDKEYLRLLPWDASICPTASMDDIDEDKVEEFVSVARKRRNFALQLGLPADAVLRHLNLIDGPSRITNAALMLFGKKPQRFNITSEIKCMQFYGTTVEKPVPAYQIYKGDVYQLVDQATSFVMSRIDTWIGSHNQSDNAGAPSMPEIPIDAVHESICNAVAHRDYTSNASVQVMLFRDRLEIWNPGVLPFGLTIQDLEGPHKSQPHNPLIAEPMFLKGYIEKAGTGTADIIAKCMDYGLRKPEFHQGADFKVIIWRKEVGQEREQVAQKTTEVGQKNAEVDQKIMKMVQKTMTQSKRLSQETISTILYAINNNAYISIKEMMALTGCGSTTVKRYLNILVNNDTISHHGPDKGGYRTINWE